MCGDIVAVEGSEGSIGREGRGRRLENEEGRERVATTKRVVLLARP
jgi:hypothetical protein